MDPGKVFWVTGLAGAGKSTVGRCLTEHLRKSGDSTVHLDGDELRMVFNQTQAYDLSSRRDLSFRYARLCQLLSCQGLSVVCSTISMFHAVREWNRANLPDYFELYLKTDPEILRERNQKDLYKKTGVTNVVGVDLIMEEPLAPDLITPGDGSLSPEQIVGQIFLTLQPKKTPASIRL